MVVETVESEGFIRATVVVGSISVVDTSINSESESECEDCNGTVVDTAVAKSDTCHEVSNRV